MTDAKHSRRSFLAMLGLAPIAAPAVVAAATAAQPASVRWTTTSTPYLRGYGQRFLIADEIDRWPNIDSFETSRLLSRHEAQERDREAFEAFCRMPASCEAIPRIPPDHSISCPVLIDDVGGGP